MDGIGDSAGDNTGAGRKGEMSAMDDINNDTALPAYDTTADPTASSSSPPGSTQLYFQKETVTTCRMYHLVSPASPAPANSDSAHDNQPIYTIKQHGALSSLHSAAAPSFSLFVGDTDLDAKLDVAPGVQKLAEGWTRGTGVVRDSLSLGKTVGEVRIKDGEGGNASNGANNEEKVSVMRDKKRGKGVYTWMDGKRTEWRWVLERQKLTPDELAADAARTDPVVGDAVGDVVGHNAQAGSTSDSNKKTGKQHKFVLVFAALYVKDQVVGRYQQLPPAEETWTQRPRRVRYADDHMGFLELHGLRGEKGEKEVEVEALAVLVLLLVRENGRRRGSTGNGGLNAGVGAFGLMTAGLATGLGG